VLRVLLLVLALVEAELDDLGANAFATAKVASMLPEPPEPEPPAPTANMVESGVFPIELTTRASVDDIFLLLSRATAAIGFTLPLMTPLSNTIFFNGSSR